MDADLTFPLLQDTLNHRIAAELPELRLPARLLQQLSEALGTEELQLLAGDVRGLGFGAYEGQLCLVTPSRVLLATGTRVAQPDAAFAVEEFERAVAPAPRLAQLEPRGPLDLD